MKRLVKYNARNIRVQSSPSNVQFNQPFSDVRELVAYFHWKSQDESLSGPPVVYCYAVDPERETDRVRLHLI
jgi:hypothetical protein